MTDGLTGGKGNLTDTSSLTGAMCPTSQSSSSSSNTLKPCRNTPSVFGALVQEGSLASAQNMFSLHIATDTARNGECTVSMGIHANCNCAVSSNAVWGRACGVVVVACRAPSVLNAQTRNQSCKRERHTLAATTASDDGDHQASASPHCCAPWLHPCYCRRHGRRPAAAGWRRLLPGCKPLHQHAAAAQPVADGLCHRRHRRVFWQFTPTRISLRFGPKLAVNLCSQGNVAVRTACTVIADSGYDSVIIGSSEALTAAWRATTAGGAGQHCASALEVS